MNKKYKAIYFINIILPLLFGGIIYILFKENTYINKCFDMLFHFDLAEIVIKNRYVYLVLICWLSDILWSYSLTFASDLVLFQYKNHNIISLIISSLFSILIEVLQYLNVIAGTFDWLDILFELLAIFIAFLIITNVKESQNGKI